MANLLIAQAYTPDKGLYYGNRKESTPQSHPISAAERLRDALKNQTATPSELRALARAIPDFDTTPTDRDNDMITPSTNHTKTTESEQPTPGKSLGDEVVDSFL